MLKTYFFIFLFYYFFVTFFFINASVKNAQVSRGSLGYFGHVLFR